MNDKNIRGRLFSEKDSDVFRAIEEIKENPDDENKNLIIRKITEEKNIFILIKLLELIKTWEDCWLIGEIFPILQNSGEEYIRASLVKAVAECPEKKYDDYILRCLDDPDPRVRANAIECVEIRGMKETIPGLVKLLKDTSPRVKINAARALFEFGDKRMLQVLKKLIETKDHFIAESAIHTLSEIGTTESLNILAEHLHKNTGDRTLLRLLSVFAEKGDEKIIPAVRKLSLSYNKRISEAAEYTMRKILDRKDEEQVCRNCGEKSPAGQKFCGSCGKKLF
ncbi:MAG: HEAT repeat domain-containing protein [Candidatus Muiribacteriaceae bacterium]